MSSVSPRPDGGAAIFAPDETSSKTLPHFFKAQGSVLSNAPSLLLMLKPCCIK